MIDRTVAPKSLPIQDVQLQRVQSKELKNGIKLYTINAGSQAVLNLQLIFKAGKWYETNPACALVMSKLMLEGTKSYSSNKINNYFDSHGIFWEISSGFDHLTIDIYLLSKYLHKISDILLSILTEALLPESEFESIITRLKQQLSVNYQKTSYAANALFRKNLLGEKHPYGYALNSELLEKLTYQDVLAYYNSHIKNKSFELVASGLIDDKMFSNLISEFETINLTTLDWSKNPIEILSNTSPVRENWKDSLQSSLRIGQLAPLKGTKDTLKFEILNRILGGYFGSRLMRNLREEKGLTYGVQSSIVYFINCAYSIISTDVIKEKHELALEEIYKEIKTLTTNKVSEEELDTVKNYVVGSFIKSINSPFSLVQYFKTIHFHKLEKEYFDHYVSDVQGITSNDILETANKYYNTTFLEIAIG